MKKIILVSFLFLSFVLVGSVYAVSKTTDIEVGVQAKDQLNLKTQEQTSNQAEDNQIQTENKIKSQIGVEVDEESEENTKVQNKIESQNKIKSQNKDDEEGKEGKEDKKNDSDDSKSLESNYNKEVNSEIASERRSQVANVVQEMLQVADRNGEVGQQIRIIAQNQNQNQDELENVLEEVQSRSGFAKFFIGPKDKGIKEAEKLLEKNREEVKLLNQLKNQLTNSTDQQVLMEQIQALEQAYLEVEETLNVSKKGFSLFGWLF